MAKSKSQVSSKDKVRLIEAIYYYGMMVFGIIMLTVGFVNGVRTASNFIFLDKYPVDGEEYRCDYSYVRMEPGFTEKQAIDSEESEKECMESLEGVRDQTKVRDVSVALSTFVVGGLIFGFHAPKTKELRSK